MSTESSRIRCTGCDYSHLEHFQPIILKCKFRDGIVTYYKQQAWCYECEEIKYSKCLPTEDELRQNYEKLYGVPGPLVTGVIT